ncbi:hypothetical protein AURDEDRAFT_173506 [Auricularia subglabra TFB-10046 SS5]|nr:hypothetical protein AURDEDRAFT_173506 [Auricularia subglabra TFB-10046 SS5]
MRRHPADARRKRILLAGAAHDVAKAHQSAIQTRSASQIAGQALGDVRRTNLPTLCIQCPSPHGGDSLPVPHSLVLSSRVSNVRIDAANADISQLVGAQRSMNNAHNSAVPMPSLIQIADGVTDNSQAIDNSMTSSGRRGLCCGAQNGLVAPRELAEVADSAHERKRSVDASRVRDYSHGSRLEICAKHNSIPDAARNGVNNHLALSHCEASGLLIQFDDQRWTLRARLRAAHEQACARLSPSWNLQYLFTYALHMDLEPVVFASTLLPQDSPTLSQSAICSYSPPDWRGSNPQLALTLNVQTSDSQISPQSAVCTKSKLAPMSNGMISYRHYAQRRRPIALAEIDRADEPLVRPVKDPRSRTQHAPLILLLFIYCPYTHAARRLECPGRVQPVTARFLRPELDAGVSDLPDCSGARRHRGRPLFSVRRTKIVQPAHFQSHKPLKALHRPSFGLEHFRSLLCELASLTPLSDILFLPPASLEPGIGFSEHRRSFTLMTTLRGHGQLCGGARVVGQDRGVHELTDRRLPRARVRPLRRAEAERRVDVWDDAVRGQRAEIAVRVLEEDVRGAGRDRVTHGSLPFGWRNGSASARGNNARDMCSSSTSPPPRPCANAIRCRAGSSERQDRFPDASASITTKVQSDPFSTAGSSASFTYLPRILELGSDVRRSRYVFTSTGL